tara:strand:+ start:402 stop:722 length:321 start_codon:yes stop_codon:yes gene_type:complete
MNEFHVGLCDGRHPIVQNDETPVNEFIFPSEVEDPLDFDSFHLIVSKWNKRWARSKVEKLYLYVTGLTPLLTAFLSSWVRIKLVKTQLVLMHYNRETEKYVEEIWP